MKGSPAPPHLSSSAQETWLEILVTDTGIGIKPEDQAKLFHAFTQVDASSSRRYEGTGLGLPLAQQVAREHGGSLGYRSRPGHTVFTLLLPVAPEEDDPAG